MMEWISSWAEGVIIAVIIATIIEMILPEGNTKKYIKVVIGVYILFTIISPVSSKIIGKDIKVSEIIDLGQYIKTTKEKEKLQNSLQEDNNFSIREIYIENLKSDIRNKLNSKGYLVEEIELDVDYSNEYKINRIYLDITELEENNSEENTQIINEVSIKFNNEQEVNIVNNKKSLSNTDKKKLKEYLGNTYDIKEKYIEIN